VKTHEHELGTIYVPGSRDSLDRLYRLAQRGLTWAADTEATGLNMFAAGFRTRLVQVGTRDEAWLLRPEWHGEAIARLTRMPETWWHNYVYDALSLEASLGLDFDETAACAWDTEMLSRLLDPRGRDKGGTGHRMEDLAPHYLGTDSKHSAKSAMLAAAKKLDKTITADTMWARMPVDMAEYEYYAGQDVLITARLADELRPLVSARGLDRFVAFERPLWRRLAQMQRYGIAFDDAWAAEGEARFDDALTAAEQRLVKHWGIKQTATFAHTSKKSLMGELEDLGARWTKFSPKTGAPSLDAEVLDELARGTGESAELARDVQAAKKSKHLGDYIRSMRAELGADGRIHPSIRPMQAATARMSVTNPPVQQFPRGDKTIRGCLIADPGHVILSADYAQVEFRIAAAVYQDPVMIADIMEGRDLHSVTATALFGPGYTDEQRNVSKGVGFGRLYLGSPRGIRQAINESYPENTPPLHKVRQATGAFDNRYKATVRGANRLKEAVERGNSMLVTATGRQLIVGVPWAAANYAIQSPARDVFAAGINALHKRGLGGYLRLVVHDEVVLSVPRDRAEEIGREVEAAMSTTFRGVPIVTESEIKGKRWSK
jgi:DNA polymerase-1